MKLRPFELHKNISNFSSFTEHSKTIHTLPKIIITEYLPKKLKKSVMNTAKTI